LNLKASLWFGSGRARWLLIALSLAPLSARSQSIAFDRLPQETLIQHLQLAPAKNEAREQELRALFEQAGCAGDHLVEQPVRGSRLPNVICTLPGMEPASIIVGAHYDKVDAGQGIVDNWSGAALLPGLFASLKKRPRRFTLLFIGFSDEERGLVGSTDYMKRVAKADKTNIRAMVNIDSLGLSSTKVWASRADKELLGILSRVAKGSGLPVDGMNVDNVGDGDSRPFVTEHIPVIDFHSITQETLPILHTQKDSMAVIKNDEYYSSYQLIAYFLAALDVSLKPNEQAVPNEQSAPIH
jgi:hypothetical protein